MPTYCYECPKCGRKLEMILRVIDRNNERLCPHSPCSTRMVRDLHAELPARTTEFDIIWSDALSVQPSQVAEHKRVHPDVPIRPDGTVGVNRARQVKDICRALGGGYQER
jgi:hypothetical protein